MEEEDDEEKVSRVFMGLKDFTIDCFFTPQRRGLDVFLLHFFLRRCARVPTLPSCFF